MAEISWRGLIVNTEGKLPQVGSKAPDFMLAAQDLSDLSLGDFTGKNLIIGFNYGTDIFRIDPDWKPEKFVPLDMSQLQRSFIIPGYHDVTLFIARLRGVKFGSTVSNADMIRKFYGEIEINAEIKILMIGYHN